MHLDNYCTAINPRISHLKFNARNYRFALNDISL